MRKARIEQRYIVENVSNVKSKNVARKVVWILESYQTYLKHLNTSLGIFERAVERIPDDGFNFQKIDRMAVEIMNDILDKFNSEIRDAVKKETKNWFIYYENRVVSMEVSSWKIENALSEIDYQFRIMSKNVFNKSEILNRLDRFKKICEAGIEGFENSIKMPFRFANEE